MPPYYVRDLNDYYLWLEKQIEYSGASLVREPLEVQLVGEDPEERPELLLVQGRQALRWPDGLVLEFDLVVDANLHPTWYRYALLTDRGPSSGGSTNTLVTKRRVVGSRRTFTGNRVGRRSTTQRSRSMR